MSNEGAQVRRWSPLGAQEQRVWQLLKRRATLVGSRTQVRQGLSDMDCEHEEIGALPKQFDRTIPHLERAMRGLVKNLGWRHWVVRCQAIPGVGPLTAVAMVATFHRGEFQSVDAFIAFMGLDVRVRDSGKFKGRRKLTKKGDSELRRLLYNMRRSQFRTLNGPRPRRDVGCEPTWTTRHAGALKCQSRRPRGCFQSTPVFLEPERILLQFEAAGVRLDGLDHALRASPPGLRCSPADGFGHCGHIVIRSEGDSMKAISAREAKYNFGRMIDTARAEPVIVEKHGRPVVVVLAVEKYESLTGEQISPS